MHSVTVTGSGCDANFQHGVEETSNEFPWLYVQPAFIHVKEADI